MPAQRTEVDDPAAALPLHQQRRLLAAEKDGLQIDGVDEVPVLLRNLQRIEPREACGIVHQPVQPPQALLHLAEHALESPARFPGSRETAPRRRILAPCAAPLPPSGCNGSRPARLLRASRSAIPRPMRLAAPVTRIVFPARLLSAFICVHLRPIVFSTRRLPMHFDLLRLDAFPRRLRQPARHMRPAPEYRGRRTQHARDRADRARIPVLDWRSPPASSRPSSRSTASIRWWRTRGRGTRPAHAAGAATYSTSS